MMKNAIHFKSTFQSQDNSSCLDFLVIQKNGLIIKIRLISKFMTSKSGKQTIAIHILPNISRSKGNQAMKLCLLVEYNKRNIFLEKFYTKYGGGNISRPFSKRSELSISLDQYPKLLCSLCLMQCMLRPIQVY